mmetsp:Transcript_43783/g.93730  ORF Transcript_43783/g.93730 Transcript_43783/m.93730 type:complete len:196 (+) Transcript_43783:1166-1753(+)
MLAEEVPEVVLAAFPRPPSSASSQAILELKQLSSMLPESPRLRDWECPGPGPEFPRSRSRSSFAAPLPPAGLVPMEELAAPPAPLDIFGEGLRRRTSWRVSERRASMLVVWTTPLLGLVAVFSIVGTAEGLLPLFLGLSLRRSLYLSVFTVWSAEVMPGEMQAIMTVREGQVKENASLSTRVSFEALKGTWASRG